MKPFNTIRVERDLPVPMADGTVLRAEVWRPDDDDPRPAILVRTPYLKELDASAPILDSTPGIAVRLITLIPLSYEN
jgi:predicted acyl esterase